MVWRPCLLYECLDLKLSYVATAISFIAMLCEMSRLFLLQNGMPLVVMGVGSTFGESIMNPLPRDVTVLTRTTCELLRVERRDFLSIWEVR